MLKDLYWIYILTGTFFAIYGNIRIGTIDLINSFVFLYLAYNIYKDKAFFEKEYLDMRMKMYYDKN